ncbi:MAG: Y-family DNA polymerase [Candidatus Delongbacteria bacterium]|nr:Y-family DNA polymerase [Candidatus Delongbacteria bacterium]
MINPIFALVDCDNFYASCERLFRPDLAGKPLVILSNNDGCIIARSNEAKALGIKMGTPFYRNKSLIAGHDVTVFSSNYALYGDISHRVMRLLSEMTPRLEVYSIDEAFLGLEHIAKGDLEPYARHIRERIGHWIGVPVSVGIGASKTLAKLATRIAKKNRAWGGIFDLANRPDGDDWLHQIEVDDIWGIGRQSAQWLKKNGIFTALHLKYSDERWIEKHLTIVGRRIVLELRGISCLPLDDLPLSRQGILCSRSFGRPVTRRIDLEEAVAEYCSRAAEKLRHQYSLASWMQVFVMTDRFKKNNFYYNSAAARLVPPCADTIRLIKQSHICLNQLYREGYVYRKAGIMLGGMVSDQYQQTELFSETSDQPGIHTVMETLDQINTKWGAHSIRIASSGIDQSWSMRQALRSNRYTTRWNELPLIRI